MAEYSNKNNCYPMPALSPELVFVDQEQLEMLKEYDLYDMLVREPSFIKKDSIRSYDYQPRNPCLEMEVPQNPHLLSSCSETLEFKKQKTLESSRITKCNCSKTKCQKNYCECFKAGKACSAECSCMDCCNDEASRVILPRKSSGFGCKCQKSHCSKRYCECHSAGKKCSEQCRCVECNNMAEKSPNNASIKEEEEEMGISHRFPSKKAKIDEDLPELPQFIQKPSIGSGLWN